MIQTLITRRKRLLCGIGAWLSVCLALPYEAHAGIFGTDTSASTPPAMNDAQPPSRTGNKDNATQANTPYGNVIGPAASQFMPAQATHPKAVDVEMGMSCRQLITASRSRDVESDELSSVLDATLSKYDIYDKNNTAIPAVHDKMVAYLLYFCKNRQDATIDSAADYAKDAVDTIITKSLR